MLEIVKDINLGTLDFGNKVVVSDPCYDPGVLYAVKVNNMKPGRYYATARIADCDDWGERVASLQISHEDYPNPCFGFPLRQVAGVDSGQCGFWDVDKYADAYKIKRDEFYDAACNATLEKFGGIIDDIGVVSASGYGDGCYAIYGAYVDDECVALEIRYIDEEEEDDEEEEYDEEDED